jgi:hypothetical protein
MCDCVKNEKLPERERRETERERKRERFNLSQKSKVELTWRVINIYHRILSIFIQLF